MEPRIVSLGGMTVVGLEYIGKDEHQEIRALWDAFLPRYREITHLSSPFAMLGIRSDRQPDDSFSYVVGVQVDRVDDVPEGMVVKHISAATYAVFEHHGPLFGVEHDLSATYQAIYREWLPRSGYRRTAAPDFDRIDERFAAGQADSVMEIYVPVTR